MDAQRGTLNRIIYVNYQEVIRQIYLNQKVAMKYTRTLVIISSMFYSLHARSPFRTQEADMPSIEIKYVNDKHSHRLTNFYLQAGPIFNTFDKNFFDTHLLPTSPIAYRYDAQKHVSGKELNALIEELLEEIDQKKKSYTNFTVLKDRDFRKNDDRTGLLIVKCNKHPFVVKLFIETPESFVNPYRKGFEPCCFFIMASGTRHLNGFTRIPNLEAITKLVKQSERWKDRVATLRKWYWLPKNKPWLHVTGYHLGDKKKQEITIPSVYAIVCDEIAIEREFDLHNSDDRATALDLANFFEQRIDPHINNYVIEKGTGKIVPIDYEFFPSMVGLKKHVPCNSYVQWYGKLSLKMVQDTFCRTKKVRRDAQYSTYTPLKDY
jgi:hypothetical protein